MQRRASSTDEFRRRLPEALAGKPAPLHMRVTFSALVNSTTGCFKRELVGSLGTKDVRQAKRLDHNEALKADLLFETAVQALRGGVTSMQLGDGDIEEHRIEASRSLT